MAVTSKQVTVDKAYFDALLRRADFHTSTLGLGQQDPASMTVWRSEYNDLLRESREYHLLKNSLFAGGITPETLALLISGHDEAAPQENHPFNSWADDFEDNQHGHKYKNQYTPHTEMPRKFSHDAARYQAPRPGNATSVTDQSNPRVPHNQHSRRIISCGPTPSSVPEGSSCDDAHSANESCMYGPNSGSKSERTLYFSGFPTKTTHRDLLSVIKGGKIISVNLFRSETSATVTFLDAAAEYLAWTKRNDIYLHSKRVEVRWADRQYNLNQHITGKMDQGATRNICIRGAASRGLTAERIQEDMEHIHNLFIVDITYRGSGDAYMSTNSVHNALFARTCMISRSTYRGCKIEFYPDECNVPIPRPAPRSSMNQQQRAGGKGFETMNRFGMLELDDDGSSDEENRGPNMSARCDDDDDDDKLDDEALDWSHQGVGV